jgi:phenylacetate-CoA ligase
MENLLVEIVDDDGQPTPDGQEGNALITDLMNIGMPFIRYRNEDRAVAGWKTCRCGRGLPLLRQVVGRQLDVLNTPDGRLVPGEFFPHLLKDVSAIRRFQVTQHSPTDIALRVVTHSEWCGEQRSRIETECRQLLGPAVRFSIEEVADIPLTALGKHRVVVNLVATKS